MASTLLFPQLSFATSLTPTSLVLVGPDYNINNKTIISALSSVMEVDKAAVIAGCVVWVSLPCKRLVYCPEPLYRDYDDLSRFGYDVEVGPD